jgi:pimeloyl-ACP methyl ester carboxylesterase
MTDQQTIEERLVHVATDTVTLEGSLTVPEGAGAVVLFAHGSGSGRHSSRNRHVARILNEAKLATPLIDLLTSEEEAIDRQTAHLRFDVELLARRLMGATDWLTYQPYTWNLRVGYFGVSTGAAAALMAAAELPDQIRGRRLTRRTTRSGLAGAAPRSVIRLNQAALAQLRCEKQLVIVPGATHLFEEPGALDEVARLAREWFLRHEMHQPPWRNIMVKRGIRSAAVRSASPYAIAMV